MSNEPGMEIGTRSVGDVLEVVVAGRLDAYWADHLARALDNAVRDGAYRLRLDMGGVSYLSSVGIRVLLKCAKQLHRLKGSFTVCNPSEAVKTVLELAGLDALLMTRDAAPAVPADLPTASRAITRDTMTFEVFDIVPGATLRCRVVGEPEPLVGSRFTGAHSHVVRVPDPTFGIGLGALGSRFADCQGRFGEFLCAAGAAAYLPTDGTNVPDYLVAAGALVPELSILYALLCEGRCAQLARFESKPDGDPLTLAVLAETCLDIAGADAAGIVMVAETAGLVGAALRHSPAAAPVNGAPFTHPQIREWLSFTAARAYPRSLALVVGVAARGPAGPAASVSLAEPLPSFDGAQDRVGSLRSSKLDGLLAPLLRPLGPAAGVAGHFHAAAFSHRPLQKGRIELQPTVAMLFDGETLHGVLHLLHDDRPVVGTGQSEFLRGACWVGPIGEITAERD
jgi:anti-anti-sigma factor